MLRKGLSQMTEVEVQQEKGTGMKERQRRKTAEGAAAASARHLLHDDPFIFADPFSIQLTSRPWRIIDLDPRRERFHAPCI